MAISIAWSSKIITIPQADLTLVSGSGYSLDVDVFRLALRALEYSEAGQVFLATHNHNTATELAGVTYARTVEIINGYTILFEDVGTPYTVVCVGANHNISDVKVVNQVSLIIGNSAGLIQVAGGGGGSCNWTSGEKNTALANISTTKDQASIAALNTQS